MFASATKHLNHIANTLLCSSLLILSSSVTAEVYENYDPCADYAAKAVYQFRSQQMLNCGLADARWNEDGEGQQNWCRTVSPKETENETKARAQLLMKCMNPHSSINQNDLAVDSARLTPEMLAAAGRGATERVQQLIAAGANFTETQKSLMHYALSSRDIKTLSFLQQAGIAVDIGQSNLLENYIGHGSDPKINASDLKMLDWLLKNGVDPNAVSQATDGDTPLAVAIRHQNLPALKLLLSAGANPNLDIRGQACKTNMPLDLAIDRGDETIMAALRQIGAKTQAQCNGG
ncbi:MAG: ankyrin repeat domain-containing protein [Thiolinea sp.]